MPFRRLLRPALLRSLSTSVRWLTAAGLVALCFGLRLWLFGQSEVLPYLLFLPAIVVSAVVLDRGSGIFATLLSAPVALYHFVPPIGSFAIPDTQTALSIGLFVGIGLFISVVTEALHLSYVATAEAQQAAEQARERAERSEQQMHLLLEEFGHRVKNDLSRIAATLRLQAVGTSPATQAALRAAGERIQVLSRVHDRLARQDGQVLVDMHNFLHDLVVDTRESTAAMRPIGIFLEAEHHLLSISRAGAVGLIANELITNALKHAFPDDREGQVQISFRREEADYLLAVIDDGIGLPDMPPEDLQAAADRRGRMGRRLIRALAAQLGGRLETEPRSSGNGTGQVLRFPIEAPAEDRPGQD